jgi:hypothetical protein
VTFAAATPPPDRGPDGPTLSDADWAVLVALQAELDLGSAGAPPPEFRFVAFSRRLVVWLWWLLDPRADGLPMPPLRDRRRRRRRAVRPVGPAGA